MLVVRHARLSDLAAPVDIWIREGVIEAVTERGDRSVRQAEAVIDADGCRVVPGLHDHHVHLRSWAAASRSVRAGPPEVADEAGLARALRRPGQGWLRAVGYHDSVAGRLDRWKLDRLVADRPVRVQHRSGAMWILNSCALEAIGPLPEGTSVERDQEGSPTGRLFRMDRWLAERLADPDAGHDTDAVSAAAAARGVTGITEAGPDPEPEMLAWLAAQAHSGRLRQRLVVMAPSDPADPVPGSSAEPPGGGSWGPVKHLLDDVGLPGLEELAGRFRAAHRRGLPVAVHCVTRSQLWLALSALEEAGAGPGDRIEHGAVIPDEAVPRLAATGAAVVTNPGLVLHRGDQYLAEVEPEDRAHLYRTASLIAAGVTVAAGTDAPFGPWDPWDAVRAATERRSLSGAQVGPGERIDPERALGLFQADPLDLKRRRELTPGTAADLCVLNGAALSEALAAPEPVAVTLIGGIPVHGP